MAVSAGGVDLAALAEERKQIESILTLRKALEVQPPVAGASSGGGDYNAIAKDAGAAVASAEAYPEAVIAFSAEFHGMPGNNAAFFGGSAFKTRFDKLNKPVFTRNLAVRR